MKADNYDTVLESNAAFDYMRNMHYDVGQALGTPQYNGEIFRMVYNE